MSAPADPTVMLLRSFCLSTMAGQYEEAIDRLVHHSIILEFDGASQRVKKAGEKTGEKAPKPEDG